MSIVKNAREVLKNCIESLTIVNCCLVRYMNVSKSVMYLSGHLYHLGSSDLLGKS